MPTLDEALSRYKGAKQRGSTLAARIVALESELAATKEAWAKASDEEQNAQFVMMETVEAAVEVVPEVKP